MRKGFTKLTLYNEKELAAKLAVSLPTLRRWRTEGRGPRFVKLSACVRYRHEDVEAGLSNALRRQQAR